MRTGIKAYEKGSSSLTRLNSHLLGKRCLTSLVESEVPGSGGSKQCSRENVHYS